MAIYKRDSINGEGETLAGDEIRMAYRIANSITSGGTTYVFDRMEDGEAVYKRGSFVPAQKPVKAPTNGASSDGSAQMTESDLPDGAILHSEFVGRYLYQGDKRYRMLMPMTKCNGQFVFVPA